ncbi:MAG: hypothetical protein EZS28_043653, partial [Streblomastix strix]
MGFVNLKTNQTICGIKTFLSPIYGNKFIIQGDTNNQILLANGETQDTGDFLPKYYPHAMGQMIIEPNDDIRNQGIRIMKNKANWDSFVLTGCNDDPSDTDGVWKMGSTSSQFRIQKQEDQAYDYKVAPLPTPPVEQAIKQSLVRGMYESFVWGSVTTYNGRG